MIFLALILIITAAIVWVTLPLGGPHGSDPFAQPDEAYELEARRRELLFALQDLDFELQTGKLSHHDHGVLRERLEADAVEVMRRLDQAHPEAVQRPRRRGAAK